MTSIDELRRLVDSAFDAASGEISHWPDPYPDRSPPDDAYSRVTNPGRYRILGARADAWITALTAAELATCDSGATVEWREPAPGTLVSRFDRLHPKADNALPLTFAYSAIESVPDAGITLGVGNPAVCPAWLPECGCDACDSGSRDLRDLLDRWVLGVVSGQFRYLTRRDRTIIRIDDDGRQASGRRGFRRGEVDEILTNPSGWAEVSGAPWF